jgi:hypothetical protein
MTYKAFHLGAKMTAKKVGNRWMVGGDYDTNGALIMLPCKDNWSGWAWYQLRGAILKFGDNAVEEEIEMTIEEWRAA